LAVGNPARVIRELHEGEDPHAALDAHLHA